MNAINKEAAVLANMANRIAENVPSTSDRLRPLLAELALLQSNEGREDLACEAKLDFAANALRRLWLSVAHEAADRFYKSPPLRQPKDSALGESLEFSYERNFSPKHLEQRIAALNAPPTGWQSDHLVFSSGQASLATLLQSWSSMLRPTADSPLRLGLFGSYFETKMMLRLFQNPGFNWQTFDNSEAIAEAIVSDEFDILLLESVRYDWHLEPLDLLGAVSAWGKKHSSKPTLTILDSTLSGAFFPIRTLLSEMGRFNFPGIIVTYASGLKLHQLGLELANVGLLSIYVAEDSPALPTAQEIGNYLRAMRTIVGSSLTVDEANALEAPWFADPDDLKTHCTSVFANNAATALALNDLDGIFAKVSHPALQNNSEGKPWAQSPFTVIHLKEDDLENHGFLLGVLGFEANQRGLLFQHGSSFGFRGHRYETIIPSLAEGKGLFKVAMGARAGPSLGGTIKLLRELGMHSNMDSIRTAYPDVQPVKMQP